MKILKYFIVLSLTISQINFANAQQPNNQQPNILPLLGGLAGAAVGAGIGRGDAGGAIAGAIIGVAMGAILQQLSEQEKANREQALQRAARGKTASWRTTGKDGKRAQYVNKGYVMNDQGQRCSKVQETITMSDGKQGKSDELVCFS